MEVRSTNKHRRRTPPTWLLLALLLVAGSSVTAQAFADDVAGRLRGRLLDLDTHGTPEAFLEPDLVATVVPPPVVLSRADAVARELVAGSRTLEQEVALRAALAICEEADRLRLDPLLVVAVMRVESAFNHLAISPAGAEGLMQLMPPTARWLADSEGFELAGNAGFDPVVNVRLGVRYLAHLRDRFATPAQWLTAYNRGPTATRAILRRQGRLPVEVRRAYSEPVLMQYARLTAQYEL